MGIADIPIVSLTAQALAEYRDERLALSSNSTVRNDLSLIRRTLETARREWGYDLPTNVASLVKLPKPGPARNRRLRPGEYEKLEWVLRDHPLMWAFVRFAIESAMRRGEILAMTWQHVDLAARMVHIPQTKTGTPRTIPLTDGGLEVLESLNPVGERVFNLDSPAIRWAWVKACNEARIDDLRFHDLRHEGVSRLFEMELMVPEVAMISGHKTASMLFRYTHLQPLELADKLKGRKRRGRLCD
jgi:integrase